MTLALIKKKERKIHREKTACDSRQISVMHPKGKECQGLPATPEAERGRKDSYLQVSRRAWPYYHFDFRLWPPEL